MDRLKPWAPFRNLLGGIQNDVPHVDIPDGFLYDNMASNSFAAHLRRNELKAWRQYEVTLDPDDTFTAVEAGCSFEEIASYECIAADIADRAILFAMRA